MSAPQTVIPAGTEAVGPTRIHIVLTCTKRKRYGAPQSLQLRAHARSSVEERAAAWIGALEAYQGPRVPADDLYAGDHWQIGRSLPALAARAGLTPTLWICSAGQGLIRADAMVAPYSATFSRPHADSVWFPESGQTVSDAHRVWWRELARWAGPAEGEARLVSDLSTRDPEASIWVIASETYLSAMRDDLIHAAARLAHSDRMVVVSAGARKIPGISANALDFDWRIQGEGGLVGGAAMSLNVRVARFLIEGGWEPSARALSERLQSALDLIAPRRAKAGQRVSEAQVEAFVREELARNPSARHTPLLRKLRDERGWGFEQKRFRALVARLRAEQGAEMLEAR